MGQSETDKAAAPPTMKCTRQGGQACTAERVKDLANAARAAGRSSRPALAGIKTLSLAASDGTLKCEQANGNPCTADQARSLRQFSAASEVTISISGGGSK
jgi:hypothetical protein